MNTPVTTPFGAQTTAAEVIAGVELTGKRAVVTGASSTRSAPPGCGSSRST